MTDVILSDLATRLENALGVVKKDVSTVRTGRAKPSLVEDVKVEAYGSLMVIKELATITTPDPTLIVIAPWDKSLTGPISNGIRKAELNVNPVVDGEVVKVAIPALTEERRKELVKVVAQKIETGKVMVRHIRTEIKEMIEAQEGESGVSEDDIKMWLNEMQKEVDDYMTKVEDVGREKEKELMTL